MTVIGGAGRRHEVDWLQFTNHYDTTRDAILTCARKPTRVSLTYRTETTIKNCKTEKLKSKKTDMLEVTVKVWGIM